MHALALQQPEGFIGFPTKAGGSPTRRLWQGSHASHDHFSTDTMPGQGHLQVEASRATK